MCVYWEQLHVYTTCMLCELHVCYLVVQVLNQIMVALTTDNLVRHAHAGVSNININCTFGIVGQIFVFDGYSLMLSDVETQF